MRSPGPSLLSRIARMIEAFEGNWLAGDFDGMILSWGPFQWNLGQGTLQPVLARIVALDPLRAQHHLGPDAVNAIKTGHIVQFARSHILTTTGAVRPEWALRFARLAPEWSAVRAFAEAMRPYLDRGQALCEALDFETERALALCCDISVQNGAPRADHVREYRKRLSAGLYMPGVPLLQPTAPEEWERLKVLALVVADLATPRWRENVLARKSAVALGRGTVHRREYVLSRDFGIRYWADADARLPAYWYASEAL
jgi:hypothetical protein